MNDQRFCSAAATSTALWSAGFRLFEFLAEGGVGRRGRNHLRAGEKPCVGGLVKNLAESREENPSGGDYDCFHAFSSARCVIMNGDSFTRASSLPVRTPIHLRTDSISTMATITIRTVVTAASRRLLKISRAVAAVAGAEASARAWARKPMPGLGSNTLCQDAVNVTATSHISGMSVTAAYL